MPSHLASQSWEPRFAPDFTCARVGSVSQCSHKGRRIWGDRGAQESPKGAVRLPDQLFICGVNVVYHLRWAVAGRLSCDIRIPSHVHQACISRAKKTEIADPRPERKCSQAKGKRLIFMLANVGVFLVCWGCLGKVKGKVRQSGQG
jgi:hypothetical protein